MKGGTAQRYIPIVKLLRNQLIKFCHTFYDSLKIKICDNLKKIIIFFIIRDYSKFFRDPFTHFLTFIF